MEILLKINDQDKVFNIEPGERLLDSLRRAGFFSVKEGCREGNCGSCVVLLDGEPVNSCIVFTASCQGRSVTTVEALGTVDTPHILQKSFVDAGAVQCGYCTPGMLLSSKALLDKNDDPSDAEICEALDGNLCRCTGYVKIIDAVRNAAKKIRKKK